MLGELVSLDVWHGQLKEAGDTAALHADLFFREARMGGEADSNVRFRMSVRKASLVLRLPEDNTIGVDRETVARDSEPVSGTVTRTIVRERKARGAAVLDFTTAALRPKINLGAEASGSVQDKTSVELQRAVSLIVSTGHFNQGSYQWDLEAFNRGPLHGRPWDAVKNPRLTLIDQRKNKRSSTGAVVLEVHCVREDLIISDIHIETGGEWKDIFSLKGGAKTAAAEALIRKRLGEELLPVTSIDNDFATLIVASVLAES
ncbi:hypothetical protein [Aureimonas ureilytica]|uniref:hypothetical protein n=1 Tax=Aureimonas ureilytica TaxID=401562 RepID=UPI00128EF506|nr:hypothetical protein [Aureimonas ureilytica]